MVQYYNCMSYIILQIDLVNFNIMLVIIDYLISQRINNHIIALIINTSVLKLMTHNIRGKVEK